MAEWHGYNIGNGTERWQDILNESWPLVDEHGKRHARGIPNRDPIAVRVRVVFAGDGETWLDGEASRWHDRSVYCEVHDARLITRGVWVDASDVQKRYGSSVRGA